MLHHLAKYIAFLNLIRPITAYLINKTNQRDKQKNLIISLVFNLLALN